MNWAARVARRPAGAFAIFFAVGLALAWRALQWPMVNDDLQMVRTFQVSELAAAWAGTWDPDGIATPGFRPLTLAFNHARGALCGESVAAHRVLLVALFALDLALLVPLGARIGLAPGAVLAAGLVMLATRYSIYHYVFITDGNHLVQGLAFLLAALFLQDGLARRSWPRLAASLLAIAAGLCVREDTLAALPALAMLAWTESSAARAARRMAWIYTGGLAVVGMAMLAWRRLVVPDAQPLGFDLAGFGRAIYHAFDPVGVDGFDLPSIILARGWWMVLGLTAIGLFAVPGEARAWTARWALAAVAACSPGLRLQRDDLLFFPSLFVALALATAWSALWKARPALRPVVAAALAWAVVGGAWMGALLAENFHPHSAQAIGWNSAYLYGPYTSANIPPTRRARAAAQLEALGVRADDHPRRRVRELIAEAKAAGRRRPTPEGRVFFPLLPERLL
jgi:hypothetical protein